MNAIYESIKIAAPTKIPCIINVFINLSVVNIEYKSKDDNNNLNLEVSPALYFFQKTNRKLALSKEESPQLKFEYYRAGTFELIKGEKIYLLLETASNHDRKNLLFKG
jgi:hypothetical protein